MTDARYEIADPTQSPFFVGAAGAQCKAKGVEVEDELEVIGRCLLVV